MPSSKSRGAGAAGGDRLASFEPGFTVRGFLCFTARNGRLQGLRRSGSRERVWSCEGPGLRSGEEKEILFFPLGSP